MHAHTNATTHALVAADNDAPGDALAEELARRLGRERCWRVRWPLNEEDHQYAAEMSGVQYVQQAAAAEPEQQPQQQQLEAGAGAEALDADAGVPAADAAQQVQADGEEDEQQEMAAAAGAAAGEAAQEPQGAAEAVQLRVQPAYYRKDANEVLIKDGPAMLRAFMDSAEPFPIRGLLRWGVAQPGLPHIPVASIGIVFCAGP